MAIFASLTRRRPAFGERTSERDLPEAIRRALPMRFDAVGEALVSGGDARAACAVVGRDVAQDGACLGEALDGLRTTYAVVTGAAPDFTATRALATAWSDASLQYLHQLSCEDPLTGLTSLAHVRTRLSEIYRDAEQRGTSVPAAHGLVVVELRTRLDPDVVEHHFTRVLRLVELAEAMRTVFSGGETIGRLGLNRAVAVLRRTPGLGESVTVLRDYLACLPLDGADASVWIEGLPGSDDSAALLLDDLARP